MELAIGIVIGVLLGIVLSRRRSLGNLRVDRSDPTSEPLLFLELDTDIRIIMRKKQVVFKVRVEDFLPHE